MTSIIFSFEEQEAKITSRIIYILVVYHNVMRIFLFIIIVIGLCFTGCEKDVFMPYAYDVILVMGQSNATSTKGFDPILDASDNNILQLGRHDTNNLQLITATEPLDHFSKTKGGMGFAMTFAKIYIDSYLTTGRKIIIVPGAKGASGFSDNYWNKGDTLYEDAVYRINFLLNNFNCKVIAVLWHQGESDFLNPDFQMNLDSMIMNFRKDCIGLTNTPFILGGLVPYYADLNPGN